MLSPGGGGGVGVEGRKKAVAMEGVSSHTLWKLRMMKRTSMGSKDESYEHVLMCLICRSLFDDYDHQPKFLPCHHTFCKDCLREYCRQIGDEIECPSCRKIANIPAAGVAALQTNFYVKYIQSLVSGSGGQISHTLECSKHSQEKLQFYCKECEKSICKECCKDSDPCQAHDRVSITKITEESHQKLDASFSGANATIEGKKVKLEKALKALAEEKDSALLKIDSTFEQHAHTLTRRATLLKNKVIDIYNEHVEKLESDLMEISTALTCIVSLKDYHEDKISHGDYKEFVKGIAEIEEVDKNIGDRIHPVETHIVFEGGHGCEKYRACAKDLGRVKFNRMATMPRTEPEGNDSGGAAGAGGSVPPSPVESPKHECAETPSTPTAPDLQSPVGTPDSLAESSGRCLPGTGFCDSTPSSPAKTDTPAKQLQPSDVAAAATAKTIVKSESKMNSSMTQSQNSKLVAQAKVCDAKSNTPKPSNTSSSSSTNEASRQSPSRDPNSKSTFTKSQITPPKQNTVINQVDSTTKTKNAKDSGKPAPESSLANNPKLQKPGPNQERVVPGAANPAAGIALRNTSGGGKARPRNLLMPSQAPLGGAPVQQVKDAPNTKAANSKTNQSKSPKEGVAVASAGQSQSTKLSRLPGLTGLCRIPKPRAPGPKAHLDVRKGPSVMGLMQRSPTGQRVSPSGHVAVPSNLRNNGNNQAGQRPILVPTRNANGNLTMQPIPEGLLNANDSDRAKAEKEYYHLLYTSYDEEELLKELKSGKANLDDSDSWMTISSGDESNSTNCSDEVLVEAEQTTF